MRAGWADGLDQALRAVERGFRWTLEASIFFQAYRELRDPGRVRALAQAVRAGHVELCATYANLEYEQIDGEEMTRVCALANRVLADEFGIRARTAILSDMPGMTWGLPQVLAASGVDYLMFWRGAYKDNLYHAEVPPIFRWESPDGTGVLVNLYGGPELHDFYYDKSAACFLQRDTVAERLREIAAWHQALGDRYPYTAVHLVIGYDNGPVLTHLLDGVRWYREHVDEHDVVLATPAAFMDEIARQRPAAAVPAVSGDFTGAWADDPLTYADAFVAKRRAAATWNVAERLAALLPAARADAPPYPRAELDAIQENLLLFTEHTYGSSQWQWERFQPRADARRFEHAWDFSRSTWTDKRAFAQAADHGSRRLLMRLAALLGAGADERGPAIRVLNPSGRARGEHLTVFVKDRGWRQEQPREARVLHAATGTEVPAQVTRGDHMGYEVCFRTPCVEPLGWDTVVVVPGRGSGTGEDAELRASGTTLENRWYAIGVTPERGVTSIVDKAQDRELLCPRAGHGAGQFIYRRVAPRFHDDLYTMRGRLLAHDPTWAAFGGERTVMGRIPERDWLVRAARTRVTACRVRHAGPVMAALELESELELDGVSCRLTQEVSLCAGERLVRFRNRLRKQETLGKEEGYLGLPLAIPDPAVHCEVANAVIRLGRDQLPGSFTGFTGLNRFVAVGDDGFTAVVSPIGPAVVEVGGIRTHAWEDVRYEPRDGALFFYVLDNLENTNAPLFQGAESWQDGFLDLDFCLTSHAGPFDPVRATRFGLRCHQELPAWVTPPARNLSDAPRQRRGRQTPSEVGAGGKREAEGLAFAGGDSTDLRNEDKVAGAALDVDAKPAGKPIDRRALRGRLMEIDADPSVVVQAIKRAEDRPGDRDRGLVVRLREVAGRPAAARLGGPARPVTAAWRCDLLENDRERLPVRDGVAEAAIPPYGLVTVRLKGEGTDGTF